VAAKRRKKRRKRRTEPDLHLMKQVEQVTISALEGPAWRFAGIPSTGITDAVKVLVFLIWQLLPWLSFGCRNSQQRPSATCLRRGNATGPTRRFQEPGHMGCGAVALATSVRPIHNRGSGLLRRFQSEPLPSRRFRCCASARCATLTECSARRCTRAPLRSFRVTVIISAVPSGGELTG
jgi:hypothetical protein